MDKTARELVENYVKTVDRFLRAVVIFETRNGKTTPLLAPDGEPLWMKLRRELAKNGPTVAAAVKNAGGDPRPILRMLAAENLGAPAGAIGKLWLDAKAELLALPQRGPEAEPRENRRARGNLRTAREVAEAARNTLTTGRDLKGEWDKRRNFYPAAKGKRGKQANLYDPRELLDRAQEWGDITKAARDRALRDLGCKPPAQSAATSDNSGG